MKPARKPKPRSPPSTIPGTGTCLNKRTFVKGAYLLHPGNSGLNIYLVESGLVRVFFANLRGEESTLYLLGPHSVVGLPILRKDQVRKVGAAAYRNSVTWVLSQEEMLRVMQRYPKLFFNVYLNAADIIRMLGTQGYLMISLK